MKIRSGSLVLLAALGAGVVGGCTSGDSGGGGGTKMVATQGPPYKEATHVLTKDSPYYLSNPANNQAPDGMWGKGTQVLVTTPMAAFSKVKIGDGKTEAYVPTANIDPKK